MAEREAEEKRITDQNVVEIDVFRRRRQAEIARQAAELEAESIRTLADAQKYKAIAEAEGRLAIIQAENALSDANRTADLLKQMMPLLMPQLPEIVKSLAPQPGVLGDARIYAFPGISGNSANGNGNGNDINKLLLSTSGLSLINTLLDEGKLGNLVAQLKGLLHSDSSSNNSNNPSEVKISKNIDSTSTIESQSLTSDYNEETEDSYSGENLVDEDGDLDFSPWAENN